MKNLQFRIKIYDKRIKYFWSKNPKWITHTCNNVVTSNYILIDFLSQTQKINWPHKRVTFISFLAARIKFFVKDIFCNITRLDEKQDNKIQIANMLHNARCTSHLHPHILLKWYNFKSYCITIMTFTIIVISYSSSPHHHSTRQHY